jgi:ribose/xylose/arabinose/galactoside ABC-type transport system permease subunit
METTTIITDSRSTKSSSLGKLVHLFGIYAVALLFILFGMLLQGAGIINNFLTAQNFVNIVDAVALLGIVACGMAFVTYSGHYADLSVPTTMALTGIVGIEFLQYGFIPTLIAALVVGMVVGFINAVVVGKFKANPIIWTLAMSYVTMGIIRFVWVNRQIYPDMITDDVVALTLFDNIYRYRFFGFLGMPVLLLIIVAAAMQFLMQKTKFGAQLKMTGSARRVARYTGINVERIIGAAFMLSAFTATVAGLAITSLSRVGAWYNGAGYDFRAVTAIVIGGMTLNGGRGNIIGVVGGALVIGLMNNIMTLLGIGTFSQDMIRGLIFIIVVGINAKSLRSLGRDDS